jgi:hypothetical protein
MRIDLSDFSELACIRDPDIVLVRQGIEALKTLADKMGNKEKNRLRLTAFS